ncbi:MAG TPA: putative zinc-binding metallopeptidase [Segetibacter sp.]|nr:putative zinc-binding metallopeptidase [Segetibacter sp.]
MKIIKNILLLFFVCLAAGSCKKEDPLGNIDNIPGLGGDAWAKGPIDNWIYDSLTVPFNIGVKYKWDQSEVDLDKTLVPPMEEKVIPLLNAIRKAWIDTYIEETGVAFFKNYSPKFFVLVGSPAYVRGAVKLGSAGGGRKVVLYDINGFRIKGMQGYIYSDSANVKQVFATIQHEYAHILDQNIKIPVEFSAQSANSYTSDWLNLSEQDALNDGFISQYSISGREEDFAEMTSLMLVEGKPWFDQRVNSINYTGTTPNGITAEQAKARLRQKEASVVSYFKQAWNIDFYSLQARTKGAINGLLF